MRYEGENWVLHVGDCLEVLPTLEAGSVAAVVADPPYGARRPSAWRLAGERFAEVAGNDRVSGEWLLLACPVVRDAGAVYLFACWDRLWEWRQEIIGGGFRVRSCIVWDKGIHGLADLKTCWAPRHEMILFAAKGRHELQGKRPVDILNVQRVNAQDLVHPYEKPVALMQQLIAPSTAPDDTVLDPFAGSGAAGEACIRMGRRYIGIESDPGHAARAAERLRKAESDRLPFPAPIRAEQGELWTREDVT